MMKIQIIDQQFTKVNKIAQFIRNIQSPSAELFYLNSLLQTIYIFYKMTQIRFQLDTELIPTGKNIEQYYSEQLKELQISVKQTGHAQPPDQEIEQLKQILNGHLFYPNEEKAEIHRRSNKIGQLDLKEIKQNTNLGGTRLRVDNKICNCCGFFIQANEINTCELGFFQVNNLGSSTVFFFQTFNMLAILLILMTLIYSAFAFITNITSANSSGSLFNEEGSLDYLAISLGSKVNKSGEINNDGKNFYLVSSWLGVAMLLVWFIYFIYIKKQHNKYENKLKSNFSVADFSVVIEKMPTGLNKQQVQKMMDEHFKEIQAQNSDIKRLKIEKYNEAKPFYFNEQEFKDDDLTKLHQELAEIKEEMKQWIKQKRDFKQFSSTKQYRSHRINEFNEVKKKIFEKNQQIVNKIIRKLEEKDKKTKTFVFITFETIEQRQLFLFYNRNRISTKIKDFLPCFQKSKRFIVSKDNEQFSKLVIESAPEPQDINWGNIGFGDCQLIFRQFLTFLATLVFLGISFVIAYALSTVQNKRASERFISILISFTISLLNLIIIKVIQHMTVVEKIYTNNKYQISIAYKSILAQLFNSIFVPIMVNFYIKDNNIYDKSGLTEDIFILAITNSLIPPLVRLIDPYYIYVSLRYYYYKQPYNKIGKSQYQLNLIAEKPQFELGYQYIYLISNFLFICFFVSLQPVIPLFGLVGLFLMYWIEKYSLFHRSQRPVPGIDTINLLMHQLIYLGGVTYALGSLTWSIFIEDTNFKNSLVANLISAGLGLLIFIFPYHLLASYKENSNRKETFDSKRIYFPAQYDRVNPVTKNQGLAEYKSFLMRKKQEIRDSPEEAQLEVVNKLINLTQNNTHKNAGQIGEIFGNLASENINQLFINQTKNTIDPKVLKQFLFPQKKEGENLNLYISALQLGQQETSKIVGEGFAPGRKSQSLVRQPNFGMTVSSYVEQNPQDIGGGNIYRSNIRIAELGIASAIKNNSALKKQQRDDE